MAGFIFLIIVQINGIYKVDKFLYSPSGKGTCYHDMSCACIMEEMFRLLGGNVVAVRLCDDSNDRFCKAHGKHLRKAADIVSAVMAETDYIRIVCRSDCRTAAEERSIRIFAGSIDCIGPGFDGLGLMVGHIEVMKAADKGGFSAAGTSHQNYLAGFYLLGKAEGAMIFFPVLRIYKSGIYGIFFGHKNTSESMN